MMRRAEAAVAALAILAWYGAVWLIVRPLADGPVVDSWIYVRAVHRFIATGQMAFAGFTQAMPVSQVLYGAGWSRLFGAGYASLDLSVAALGAICAFSFYVLVRRCGARHYQALLATGLLAANPCYLFLSFSFMTEVPFLAPFIGSILAFAIADSRRQARWRWLSAGLATVAFMVRPFGGAAIAGCAGAILLRAAPSIRAGRASCAHLGKQLLPYAAALIACAFAWTWLTVLRPEPYYLALAEHQLEFIFDVRAATYFHAGLLEPLLYLGLVLSPLGIPRLFTRDWRRGTVIAAALFVVAALFVRFDPTASQMPCLSCFGGWTSALVVRPPTYFEWWGYWQLAAIALGSCGAAGLILAAIRVAPKMRPAAATVLIASGLYWAAIPILWLFNDRYDVVLVPAGCLLLALAPMPRSRWPRVASAAMLAALALFSLAGVYEQQRGLAAIRTALDQLEREDVARGRIDAGYPFNGADLYRAGDGKEELSFEAGIPMVTSLAMKEYTIATSPLPGTHIVRRMRWAGFLGIGDRELYVLRRSDAPTIAPAVTGAR